MKLIAEFTAGTDIESAFKQAVEFSDKNNVTVQFMFNGIMCN